MFHISVFNRTFTISDVELHRVVRGVNRQIAEDAVRQRIGAESVVYTRAVSWAELGNPAGFESCRLWAASYRPDHPNLPAGWATTCSGSATNLGRCPGSPARST